MDIEIDLGSFSNQCRLFPLPDLVLFPHAILPLHIFEPRYRQMTEDALGGEGLVTIVQIRPESEGSKWTEPVPIMDVGCLGKIVRHERLPDGRFHLLLLGCKRVRLTREVPSVKLYRIAEATILEDQESGLAVESCRHELIPLFLQVFERTHRLDPELSSLLNSGVPLGVLSDIIAHALHLPWSIKQDLLGETGVDRRVAMLCSLLKTLLAESEPSRGYLPPFSLN